MSRKSILAMAGGTIACALGIGFFMQRGAAPVNVAPQEVPIKLSVMAPMGEIGGADGAPVVQSKLAMSTAVTATPMPPRLSQPSLDGPGGTVKPVAGAVIPAEPTQTAPANSDCTVIAKAVPAAMASIDLDVSAPCYGGERVTVHHKGMMFTDVTDANGGLSLTVPVLSEKAVFIIAFANGKGAVTQAHVPSLADYDRIVLQWSGNNGFQIHAREFGAAYGEEGHIWSGSAIDANGASGHGIVVRLGFEDTIEPQMAEVYTFPSGTTSRKGAVALSIEAEVTKANCDRDIAAQSLELRSGSELRTRDLTLSVPNCGAVGDFLVLNNLVEDLKIASN